MPDPMHADSVRCVVAGPRLRCKIVVMRWCSPRDAGSYLAPVSRPSHDLAGSSIPDLDERESLDLGPR